MAIATFPPELTLTRRQLPPKRCRADATRPPRARRGLATWRAAGLGLAACLASGCATAKPADVITTDVGEYSYVRGGQGEAIVVFESGMGGAKDVWAQHWPTVGGMARYFAYDRPRQGQSRSRNETRDGLTIVNELHALLRAAELPPPYILVGGSMGGMYMELYARTYPQDVRGVVLVESRAATVTQRCEETGSPCDPATPLGRFLAPRRFKGEVKAMKATEAQVQAAPPFPEVPLAVLTGTQARRREGEFMTVWIETQQELAELSPISKHIVCDTCSHGLHIDRPDLLIDALEWVLEASAESAGELAASSKP
ncbi:MAG: alpha/beta hydrolase [Myxococcales bacterium FL481]|nr:MAG: alpha/beta hydrolase [Myxococcales bacterium FL481]